WYAAHRDCFGLPNGQLCIYDHWNDIRSRALEALRNADVGVVTSYCHDGVAATDLVLDSAVDCKLFYDLDTPITLERLTRGESVAYLGPRGLGEFDLVLSYTGGASLTGLTRMLGARKVAPLYGSVDTQLHA